MTLSLFDLQASITYIVGLIAVLGFIYFLANYLLWRNEQKSKPFNAFTTNEEALNGMNLNGKLAIVTGCNAGIGKETVRLLAKHGCKVIMACRILPKRNKQKTIF